MGVQIDKPTEPGKYIIDYCVTYLCTKEVEVFPEDITEDMSFTSILLEDGLDSWDSDMHELEITYAEKVEK